MPGALAETLWVVMAETIEDNDETFFGVVIVRYVFWYRLQDAVTVPLMVEKKVYSTIFLCHFLLS